jgi:hypothetical protein
MVKLSEFEVTTRDLYVPPAPGETDKQPAPQGLLDRRLVSLDQRKVRKGRPSELTFLAFLLGSL